MRPDRTLLATLAVLALPSVPATAQTTFGAGCAGASGVTPELTVSGPVRTGSSFTLSVAAPGGLGLGYLLIGFSNTSASLLGGAPLPLDLGTFFADPLWSGCSLNVDPSWAVRPYTFDPNANGGVASFTFPGFDTGRAYLQALNVDPDFVTRVAGVSAGLELIGGGELVPGLVAIPPGTFQMGSAVPSGAPFFPNGDEQPVHAVTISSPFWMAQYETTQQEYEALTGSNPSQFVGAGNPVERVSVFDAMAYCQALTAQEALAGRLPAGYEYRLPTEAEWEYACRAGTTTEYNTGVDALLCGEAWFHYSYHSGTTCAPLSGTVAVGGYAPNAWGLFDMHGNVWEFCLDAYAPYSAAPATDPLVTSGLGVVTRGGCWLNTTSSCRSASRQGVLVDTAGNQIGFRVVLAPVLVAVK